jgi:eukaryotic-like serine/threonine-protein kinase
VNFTDPFVLGDDVLLIPCTSLGDDLRRRIAFDEGDYTVSRRDARVLAQVIDRDTAALLELFREPRTLVEAVFENSRSLGRDPETSLDELLPHLGTFVSNRVLVPAGAVDEIAPEPDLAGYDVVRAVSVVEDRAIYELRGGAALKIARQDTPELRRLFANEAAILRHLDGSGLAPRLLEATPRSLVMEWLPSIDGGAASDQCRSDRRALLALCASIAEGYAALHERGVLHGDVHWQNVIVDGDRVRLLDFGYARFTGRRPRMGRAAIPHFFEPEFLAAQRKGRMRAASAAGEQYAVAALLYLLITGQPYLDLRFEAGEMARQIESEAPLPFEARGVEPWPEVERILVRGLEKNPRRRYASMREMATALLRESPPAAGDSARPTRPRASTRRHAPAPRRA